ncbi:DUF6959 family protein [Hamadaea tsunoensis]|uniref:DUF6959 family protein n=1 Tax=Hamadaea tsunoensis TaxID=53368 RepID=UPI000427615E|nr:hypothetical protein [Hamadaea tsunoensis]
MLRLPGRRFPGLFVQGDTLSALRDLLDAAADSGDGADVLAEARSTVYEWLHCYEDALDKHGITLPYAKPADNRGEDG